MSTRIGSGVGGGGTAGPAMAFPALHPPRSTIRPHRGFTLLELMVVMFIMLLIAGLAVASMRQFLETERIRLAGGTVDSAIRMARQYAMSKRNQCMVEFISPTKTTSVTNKVAGVKAEFFYRSSGLASYPTDLGEVAAVTRTDGQISYASTTGAWSGLAQADNFASRFTGYVRIPADGTYTFYTESDDGSRLWLDGNLLVNNDGWHGMVEVGGSLALTAGDHEIRVEQFEGGGGAGLIVKWAGPSIAKQTIPAGVLYHDEVTEVILPPDPADDLIPRQVRITPYRRWVDRNTGGFTWLLEEDVNALKTMELPRNIHFELAPGRALVRQYDPADLADKSRDVYKIFFVLKPDGTCSGATPDVEDEPVGTQAHWASFTNTVILRDLANDDLCLMYTPPATAFTRTRFIYGGADVEAFVAAHAPYVLW
ncbi:MAG TPA: PA14 domain-containing protein [Planctomycetota bacterium]|nr:PA14 domain-containing protein [Planctomycetota bacterium]